MVDTMEQRALMFSRFVDLGKLVLDGQRDIEYVLEVLRIIENEPNFFTILLGDSYQKIVSKLVEPLSIASTVKVAAMSEQFVTREKFVVGIGREHGVWISRISENFHRWFFDKVENAAPETMLDYVVLKQSLSDQQIMEQFGDASETRLAQIYKLMEHHNEQNALLTNGPGNIFYVRDVSGCIRAVNVGSRGVGWTVNASSLTYPNRRTAGRRVFCRSLASP